MGRQKQKTVYSTANLGARASRVRLCLMSPKFPTQERNILLKRLASDPRWAKTKQERPAPPLGPPQQLKRVAKKGRDWNLPRSFPGYVAGHASEKAIGGNSTKWVLQGSGGDSDVYIAKFGNKNGRTEVVTELFNNQLGSALGFEMAHSGLARLDGQLYFVTQNFVRMAALIHGSLMIEDFFGAKDELEKIRPCNEQEFYSINFIYEVINRYCGEAATSVLEKFFEMLMFDALIGSMDRHGKNWGVLRSEFAEQPGQSAFRLAPIFDSARALLWDHPEGKLLLLDNDDNELMRYVESARPCVGPPRDHPKVNNCNHFHFIHSLMQLYPHLTLAAYEKIPLDMAVGLGGLFKKFPFRRVFFSFR